jgi:hypothetical protein
LTATLTAGALPAVRGLVHPGLNRVAVPFWRARIQLGLAVDVLDDRLTELFLGKALLEAGQEVTNHVAGGQG